VVLAHLLRQTVPVAGVMALSSYLPLGGKNAEEITEAAKGIPVFMAHGSFDPVVPIGLGEYSRRQLQQFGLQVQFKSYPMQHNVCPDEIRAMGDWLSERFATR
jgi:phospholipase/carboxylesterase